MISYFFLFVNSKFKILYIFFVLSHYKRMRNSVGKGAFILIVSGMVCKIFGALFRLPLTNIITIRGIGIFQMIMSLYSLSLGLVSSGVTNALSKLISGARARGENNKIGAYFKNGLMFSGVISLCLGLIFITLSRGIASLQGYGDADISYMLLAILLPLGALIGCFRGVMQGYENMTPTAVSQIIEQLFKFAFGLLFAYLFRQSIGGGVFGAFLGITVSEFLAFLFLLFAVKKVRLQNSKIYVKHEFLKAVTPMTLSAVIIPLSFAVESLIIISLLSRAGLDNEFATTLYGLNSGVVGAILHFPLVISVSVAMVLLPKISFLSEKKDKDAEKIILNKAFTIMWFLLIPLILGINSIARNLYPIIYPSINGELLEIALQLTLFSGFAVVLNAFSQLLNAVLQAKGFYNHSLAFFVIGALAKILSLIILSILPNINIYAIPISNVVLYSSICICALIKLGTLIKIDFYSFSLPLISSFVMFLVVKIWLSLFSNIWGILSGVIVGGSLYILLCLPLLINYGREIMGKLKIKS